jgi:hypothetical protein
MKLFILLSLFFTTSSYAFDGYSKLNIGTGGQIREGANVLSSSSDRVEGVGNYNGFRPTTPTLLIGYERMLDDEKSFFFGGEVEASQNVNYFLTAGGMNFFLGGNPFSFLSESPFFGYYGFRVGISSIKIVQFSQSLSADSTGLEPGLHIGGSYHLSKDWQVSSEIGYALHYGFSTVATTNSIFKGNVFLSRKF